MDYPRGNNGPTGGSFMGLTATPKYLYKYAIANFDEGHEGKCWSTKKGIRRKSNLFSEVRDIFTRKVLLQKPQPLNTKHVCVDS